MAKQLKLFESYPSGGKNSNNDSKSKSNPSSKPNSTYSPKSERVKKLQAEIEYHQHLYYNAQPEISDEEFDKLWDALKQLDPNN